MDDSGTFYPPLGAAVRAARPTNDTRAVGAPRVDAALLGGRMIGGTFGDETYLDGAPETRLPRVRDLVVRSAAEVRRTAWRRRAESLEPADEVLRAPVLVGLLAALRASVRVYVCARRDADIPIWRVLPEVKALVHEADPSLRQLLPLAPLVQCVVRWTIEAYYDRGSRDDRGPYNVGAKL